MDIKCFFGNETSSIFARSELLGKGIGQASFGVEGNLLPVQAVFQFLLAFLAIGFFLTFEFGHLFFGHLVLVA